MMTSCRQPAAPWLRKRVDTSDDFVVTKAILRECACHTVCESARCPNINECFSRKTATFMILGDRCARACSFCAVTKGAPREVDEAESERIASAVERLGLSYVVVTSVTRDDLPDGGASQFVRVITALKSRAHDTAVEVLVPDFLGDEKSICAVAGAGPDIFAHNIETVERLYPSVRNGADYRRSLSVLRKAKEASPTRQVKTSLMVGLGERTEEVIAALKDIRSTGCDIVTIGQYLSPGPAHAPVARYVAPEEHALYEGYGTKIGFKNMFCGTFIRSSYRAEEVFAASKGGIT